MIGESPHISIFRALGALEKEIGVPLYLVGGYVRDLVLRAPLLDADIDLTLEGDAIRAATVVQKHHGGEVRAFAAFGTAKLVEPESFPEITEIDFAPCRSEVYTHPGALPKISTATLHEDLKRRDFSINAIAARVSALSEDGGLTQRAVVDPFHGISDLHSRIIRVLHDGSFIDDPTRLFRAIRYLIRIGGSLEAHTDALFQEALRRDAVKTISMFRIFSEIRKMCGETFARQGLSEFEQRGLLSRLHSYGISISSILSSHQSASIDYEMLLGAIFRALEPQGVDLLARELNISKKEAARIRAS